MDYKNYSVIDNTFESVQGIIGKVIDLKEIEKDRKYKITAKGWKQLNEALHQFRSKSYEIFRYILVNTNGEIVHHLAITSCMPNFCNVSERNDTTLKEVISKLEEDNLWLVVAHNHPSGNVKESTFDRELTESFHRSLSRNDGCQKFLGHIIFDHFSYNYTSDAPFRRWNIKELKVAEPDPIKPMIPKKYQGMYIGGTMALKEAVSKFKTDKLVVVFTNADRNLVGIKKYGLELLDMESEKLRRKLMKVSSKYGAIGGFAIVTKELWTSLSYADQTELETKLKSHVKDDAITDAAFNYTTITEKYDMDAGRNFYSFYRDNSEKSIKVKSTWVRSINTNLFPCR